MERQGGGVRHDVPGKQHALPAATNAACCTHLVIYVLPIVETHHGGHVHKGWVLLAQVPPVVGGGGEGANKRVHRVPMRVVHHGTRVEQIVLVEQDLRYKPKGQREGGGGSRLK